MKSKELWCVTFKQLFNAMDKKGGKGDVAEVCKRASVFLGLCWNYMSIRKQGLVLDFIRNNGEKKKECKGERVRETSMDFAWLENRSQCSRESKKEREKKQKRLNTSYCWNAVATRGREEGGGVCVCLFVCVHRGQWVLSSVRAAPCQRCIEFCAGNLATMGLNY